MLGFLIRKGLTRQERGTARPASGVGRWIGLLLALLLSFWLGYALLLNLRAPGSDGMEPSTGPMLLAIQKLGQLHTVSFRMKDVLRQETQSDPEGWVSAIPGADSLVHWATHNEALLLAEGSVEAGIDLSRISEKDLIRTKRADGSVVLRLHLPPITVYPPNVHLRVVSDHPGLFWRDRNIVPKAQYRASRMFQQSAEQGGIRQAAQTNAIQTLEALEHAMGHHNIEFQF